MRVTLGNGQRLTQVPIAQFSALNRLGRGAQFAVCGVLLSRGAAEGDVAVAAAVGSPTKRHGVL